MSYQDKFMASFFLLDPGRIGDIPEPSFAPPRYPEASHLALLQLLQPWFTAAVNNPAKFAARLPLDENEYTLDGESVDPYVAYVDYCVSVRLDATGKYIVNSDGTHRLYVAKKYGLPILVSDRTHPIDPMGI